MEARKLFQEIPGSHKFHSCVMTTYAFDFHHFESQVLRVLKAKHISNISVLVDNRMLEESLGFASAHLKNLSTSYTLNGLPSKGAFHPKLTLCIGDEALLLLLGSGNISPGGHGKNHELFTAFYADSAASPQLPLIQEAWSYVRILARNLQGLSADKLSWIEDNTRLLNAESKLKHTWYKLDSNYQAALLYNEPEQSLYQQLLEIVGGDSIEEIQIFAPFYDPDGKFLQNLLADFPAAGIKAFLQKDYGQHPIHIPSHSRLKFYAWEETERAQQTFSHYARNLHAKILWFRSARTQFCLIGSPNATFAAFGSKDSMGKNEELAVLYQGISADFLIDLGLSGANTPIQLSQQPPSFNRDEADTRFAYRPKIIINGADRNGRFLTVFFKSPPNEYPCDLLVFDQWGNELMRQGFTETAVKKLQFKLQEGVVPKAATYVQLLDAQGETFSNKQLINDVELLLNTHPSRSNRDINRLIYKYDTDNWNEFDAIQFFTLLYSASGKEGNRKKRDASGSGDKNKNRSASSLTYDEAIELAKEQGPLDPQIKNSNAIRVWDALDRLFKNIMTEQEEAESDDEEYNQAAKGRKREERSLAPDPLPLSSEKVLKKRRKELQAFLSNYQNALHRALESEEEYRPNLLDVSMFLIVFFKLCRLTEREVKWKNSIQVNREEQTEKEEIQHVFPRTGGYGELHSFQGAVLNLLGAFISLVVKGGAFEVANDRYFQEKQTQAQTKSQLYALFALGVLSHSKQPNSKLQQEWLPVLARNVFQYWGSLPGNWEQEFKVLYEKSSIRSIPLAVISKWVSVQADQNTERLHNEQIQHINGFGWCLINKTIRRDGKEAYLKLERPGFSFNTEEKTFLKPGLYSIETGKMMKSKQEIIGN